MGRSRSRSRGLRTSQQTALSVHGGIHVDMGFNCAFRIIQVPSSLDVPSSSLKLIRCMFARSQMADPQTEAKWNSESSLPVTHDHDRAWPLYIYMYTLQRLNSLMHVFLELDHPQSGPSPNCHASPCPRAPGRVWKSFLPPEPPQKRLKWE